MDPLDSVMGRTGVRRRQWLRATLSGRPPKKLAKLDGAMEPTTTETAKVQQEEREEEGHRNDHEPLPFDDEIDPEDVLVRNQVSTSLASIRSALSERELGETKWQAHLQTLAKQEQKRKDEMIEHDGESFIAQVRAGQGLFNGTGLEGQDLHKMERENVEREAELLKETHTLWRESKELSTFLSAGLSIEEKRKRENAEDQVVSSLALLRKKREFLDKVRRADAEARQAHLDAESKAAEAFEMFEKLRTNKMLSFEARAKLRREMLATKAQASKLEDIAVRAKEDARLLKKHIIQRGLQPETFVSYSQEQSVAKKANTTSVEQPTKSHAHVEQQEGALQEVTKEEGQGDIESNEMEQKNISEWDIAVREGHKLAHLDLHDRAEKRIQLRARAEKEKSAAEERDNEYLHQIIKLEEKNPFATIDLEPPVKDHMLGGLLQPNLSFQPDRDVGTIFKTSMTKDTAPPMCIDWALRTCPKQGVGCKARHFFVSPEEKSEWNEKRENYESDMELRVLEKIAKRESILHALHTTGEACRREFQSHFSGFVSVSDIAPLLDLMDQLRIATVQVIEAIVHWRKGTMEAAGATNLSPSQKHLQPDIGAWVVKLGYEASKLYPGSKAFESKVRRFRRDADQHGKRAIEYKLLGIFKTRFEALQAYDVEIKRLAAERMSSLDKFPRPKVIIRSCGKHFAVESDMGVDNTRCEICYVRSFNEFKDFSAPYIWNGENYLLKLVHDSDFLAENELLRLFFARQLDQEEITFKSNPFLLATSIRDGKRRVVSESSASILERRKRDAEQVASSFGIPTDAVLQYQSSSCIEWLQHISSTGGRAVAPDRTVKVGEQLAYISQLVFSKRRISNFVNEFKGASVDILDMNRIRKVQQVVEAERQLCQYMYKSKLLARKDHLKLQIEQDKIARKQERMIRRANGEQVETSDEEEDKDDDDDDDDRKESEEHPEGGKEGGHMDILTDQEREFFLKDVVPEPPRAHVQPNKTAAELLPESRLHTTYYWDRGEYIAIQQPRHEHVGKIEKKWATGDPGTTFEGMETRGKHLKHFKFERDLKKKGKALVARREKFIKRLDRSLKRKDRCNPDTIQELVSIGSVLGGSLVEMDCKKADKFLKEWFRRRDAAVIIQCHWRASKARAHCRTMRQRIARKARHEVDLDRKAHRTARQWTRALFARTVPKAQRRLKKPLVTFGTVMDGESLIVSVYHTSEFRQRYVADAQDLATLLEPCFACLGTSKRIRPRRDLTWTSVRGLPCIPGDLDAAELGVMKVHRVEKVSFGGGPCYCRRKDLHLNRVYVKAYNPHTCKSYTSLIPTSVIASPSLSAQSEVEARLTRAANGASSILLTFDSFQTSFPLASGGEHVFQKPYSIDAENWLAAFCKLQSETKRFVRIRDNIQRLQDLVCNQLHAAEDDLQWKTKAYEQACQAFSKRHGAMLAAEIHFHAMSKACENAMLFSKRQIELYEDLTLSTNQQAWDPKENANDTIFIQRKRHAARILPLARKRREEAHQRVFHAEQTLFQAKARHSPLVVIAHAIKEASQRIQTESNCMEKLLQAFQIELRAHVKAFFQQRVVLRIGTQKSFGTLKRCILVDRVSPWSKGPDLSFSFRAARSLFRPRFLNQPLISMLAVVSIAEQVGANVHLTRGIPCLLPAWAQSAFTWTAEDASIRAFDPELSLSGFRFQPHEVNRVELGQALKMLVPYFAATSNFRREKQEDARALWTMDFSVEDAICQPPFLGMIHLSAFHPGCCRELRWEINPIELRELLCSTHHNLPGSVSSSRVFSYGYLGSRLSALRNRTHETSRHVVQHLRMEACARLVELMHIGLYDGEIKVGKLEFFRTRRTLFQALFETQWWKDIGRARSTLKGSLVYQGVRVVAKRSGVVKVFENHGDLTIHVAWIARGIKQQPSGSFPKQARVTLTCDEVQQSLASGERNATLVHLWNQSVSCGIFPPVVIEQVLRRLLLLENDPLRRGLCLNDESNSHGTVYTGLRQEKRPLWGKYLQVRKEFSDLEDPRLTSNGGFERPTLLLAGCETDLFELVHREVVLISGHTFLVSGFVNDAGDIRIDAQKQNKESLSLCLGKVHLRRLFHKLGVLHLLAHSKHAEMFALLFSLLAVRQVPAPPPSTRDHPLFARFSKMLKVGVPRLAVLQAVKLQALDFPYSPLSDQLVPENVESVAYVLFDTDHDATPGEQFSLPRPKVEKLILSQSHPEEHFRLLHRGSVVCANQRPCYLEILERNQNVWLRARRETEREKNERVQQEETTRMLEEDQLTRQVKRYTAEVQLQRTNRRQRNQARRKTRRELLETLRKNQVARQNELQARKERYAAFVNSVATELQIDENGIVFENGLRCQHVETEDVFPEILVQKTHRIKHHSAGHVAARVVVRGKAEMCVNLFVQVYIPSIAKVFKGSVAFEQVDESLVNRMIVFARQRDQDSESPELEACSKESLLVRGSQQETLRRHCFRTESGEMVFARVFLVVESGDYGLELHQSKKGSCYYKQSHAKHRMVMTDASFAQPSQQALGKMESASEYSCAAASCAQDEQHIQNEVTEEGCSEVDGDSEMQHSTKAMYEAIQRLDETYLHKLSTGWREKKAILERLESSFKQEVDVSEIFAELFDAEDQKLVGDGPTTGGSTPEKDANAHDLTKHSIMLNWRMVEMLRSGAALEQDTNPSSVPGLIELVRNRLFFYQGDQATGSADSVAFDKTLFVQGILFLTMSKSAREAKLEPGVASAKVSSDGKRLYLETYLPSKKCFAEVKTLDLDYRAGHGSRDLVGLAWAEKGIHQVSKKDMSLLDPRMCVDLCKALLRRSVVIDYGNGVLRLVDKTSRECTVISERQLQADEQANRVRELLSNEITEAESANRAALLARVENELAVVTEAHWYREQRRLQASIKEWALMEGEDRHACVLRPYLTAPGKKVNTIELAFNLFDVDGSGSISKEEFSALVYEIGQVLTEQEVDAAMKEMDVNGDGSVDKMEFAMWWLTSEERLRRRRFNLARLKLRTVLALRNQFKKVQSSSRISQVVTSAPNGGEGNAETLPLQARLQQAVLAKLRQKDENLAPDNQQSLS